MKKNGMKNLLFGGIFIATFVLWTVLIQMVDVQPHGQNGTNIGFATLNCWFHRFTGVHMMIYSITDWMGLVPVVVCLIFAGVGLVQLIKKRSLFKVDPDIIILGIYYIVVILAYIFFEMIPINYRPILINGVMEASYPSSTIGIVCDADFDRTDSAQAVKHCSQKSDNDCNNRFFGIHGYWQIDFGSTLAHGYCRWRIVKHWIIFYLSGSGYTVNKE